MSKPEKLGPNDVGCYADGAHGWDHVRARLSGLVRPFDSDLADELLGEMSDDASEELDAMETLNDEACEFGVSFGFADGDLVLGDDDFWENA